MRSASRPPSARRCTRRTSAGPRACCGAALEAKVPKVVYVSTVGVFGNTHGKVVDETYEHPGKDFTSYYEETKLEAHQVAKRMIAEEGLPVRDRPARRRLRPRRHLLDRRPARTSSSPARCRCIPFPELGICMAHVEDIAAGILLALDKGETGEAYVISGPVTTMREAIGDRRQRHRQEGAQARDADRR